MSLDITTRLDPRWRVRLRGEFDLPMPIERAWAELRDFHRYACMDWFHRRVLPDTAEYRAGSAIVLVHGVLGLSFHRPGRILWWNEGRGYAFSDLSAYGPKRGFPHVYRYQLTPEDETACRFRLEVSGLWTARFLPRSAVRLWLAWNLWKTALTIRYALLRAEWRTQARGERRLACRLQQIGRNHPQR